MENKKSVLFIGGGRRNSLCKRFINNAFNVYSYETNIDCPISKAGAKIIKGLSWSDKSVKEHIKNVVLENNIDLLIPLQDQAVVLLAEAGIPGSVVSELSTAEICFDKKKLETKFIQENLKDIYPFYNYKEFIEKPRFGFNSKGISINRITGNKDVVFQAFIKGEEYSVDAYFDKNSLFVDAVPRTRNEVKGGEVVVSTTIRKDSVEYKDIISHIKRISSEIKFIGPVCFQFMKANDGIYLIEINARFGGGVILSLEAGFDIVGMIEDEYIKNKEVTISKWEECITMSRFFDEKFSRR